LKGTVDDGSAAMRCWRELAAPQVGVPEPLGWREQKVRTGSW